MQSTESNTGPRDQVGYLIAAARATLERAGDGKWTSQQTSLSLLLADLAAKHEKGEL